MVIIQPSSSTEESTNCFPSANSLSQGDAGGTSTAQVGEQCLQFTPCCEDQTMKMTGMLLPPSWGL